MAKHRSASTTPSMAPNTPAQRLPAGFTAARNIGRVGMLAVALGVGFALSTPVGIAHADDNTSADSPSSASSPRTPHAPRTKSKPATATPTNTTDQDNNTGSGAQHPAKTRTTLPHTNTPTATPGTDPTANPIPSTDPTQVADDQSPKPQRRTKNQARQPKKAAPAATTGSETTTAPKTTQTLTPTATQRTALTAVPVAAKTVAATNNPAAATTTGPVDPNVTVTSPATTNPIGKLLAIPGSLITGIMNALKPILFQGGDVPANPPLVWALLAWTRRQFINDAPQFSTATITPNAGGITTVDVNATDPDGDKLTYTASSAAHGTVTVNHAGDADGSTFTYTPNAGYAGTDTFTITASDKSTGFHLADLFATGARSTTTTITINVAPSTPPQVSDTPFGIDTPQPGDTPGIVRGHVNVTGATGYSGPANPPAGLTVNSDGSFVYTPTDQVRHNAAADGAHTTGADQISFTVTASNSIGDTDIPVTVTIAPLNAAPTPPASTPGTTDHTNGAVTGNLGYTDGDNDQLKYTLVSPSTGTTSAGGIVTVDANGNYTYTPTAQQRLAASGTPEADADHFTVSVDDGHGSRTDHQISVTIDPTSPATTNTAPVSVADNFTVTAGQTLSTTAASGVLANDSDAENDVLTAALVANAAHGTLHLNADGSFTYSANANYTGPDSFTYKTNDGTTDGNTATVSITVNIAQAAAINGIPLGNAIVGATGTVYQPITRIDDQGNFSYFVRSYQSSGALIGDSPTYSGLPSSNPVVRTDGGIAVVSYDQASQTATVRVINGTTVTTTTVHAQSAGVAAANGRQYLVTGYRDENNVAHGNVIPLTVGAITTYEATGTPAFGSDGTLAAYNVTGTSAQDAAVSILVIDADGNARTETAPALLRASGGLAVGPRGTVYAPTLTDTGSAVLVFNSSGSYTTVDMPGMSVSPVTVAPDGTAYAIADTPVVDGNFHVVDNYKIAVVTGGGLITTATFSTSISPPTIIGASKNGTLYVLDSDSGNDAGHVVVVRPNGGIASVGTGNFSFNSNHVIGSDNNLYVNYEDANGDFVSAVITPDGQKRVLPSDMAPPVFDDDGTAYAMALTPNGAVVRVSTDGYATFRESTPVAGTPTGLSVGPDGTVVLLTSGSSSVATTFDPTGSILATIVSTGEAMGTVFDDNTGSAYVAVVQTDPSTSETTTSVWGMTLAGATKIQTVSGTPAGLLSGTAGAAIISITQTGAVFMTTMETNENGLPTTTNVHVAPGVSLPPSPYQVSRNTTDYTTGASTVTITVKPGSGLDGTITYTGSTHSPIGDVVVNPDGTVTFTPNVAGRLLAAQSAHIEYAGFVVTATDSEGNSIFIPVSAPLLPTGFPTNPVPMPLKYYAYSGSETFADLPGLIHGINPYHSIIDVSDYQSTKDANGLYSHYQARLTRISGVDPDLWTTDPLSGLPVEPEIYVVQTVTLGSTLDDTYVIGYRKLDLGDAVTVTGTPYSDYHIAVFAPGTFPKQLFTTRHDPDHPDAEVGGNIFNNQIPDDTWTPWQEQEDELYTQHNYDETMRIRSQYIGQGSSVTLAFLQWTQGARGEVGEFVTAGSNAKRVIKGVKLVNGVVQLVSDENEIINQNGNSTTPVFIVDGAERSTPPQLGIPD